MNSLVRAAVRLAPLSSAASPLRLSLSHTARPFARSLWHMCSSKENSTLNNVKLIVPSQTCSCGCRSRQIHTKGERELIEFLSEEIATESKNRKVKTLPAEVEGFKVTTDGADVILSKSNGEEKIEVHLNVNHTVDTEAEPDIDPTMDKPEFGELKSKPTFDVDIKRGSTTLSFTCSFFDSQQPASEEGYNDIFGIDEVALYEGEWKDNNYAVAGEVLDGCLYDLLMNLLDEKGISNDFVEKLSEFSTAYENHLYINMLQSIQKFTSGK